MSDGLALIHTSATGGGLGRVLDLISAPESHGNDNAWYGHADQQQVELSTLTVDAVKAFQQQLLADGHGGSAIGRYQIVPDTFATLTERLHLSGNERFTPALQDRLALALVSDAGVNDWIAGRVDDQTFAFNLSKIWAGLPKDASNVSYYAGDGRNAAHLDHGVVIGTLAGIRAGAATDAPAARVTLAPAVRRGGDGETDAVLRSPLRDAGAYRVTSEFFADRAHPVTGVQRPHRGVDIATPDGTPIDAPADGIARTGKQDAAGQYIALDHDLDPTTRAFETKFFHLSDVAVEPGQRVQQGDLIGHTGHSGVGTGPHLHVEVWRDGEAINPRRDPNMPWGLARDGDVSAPTLAATANPGGESVARRETHLPGSPAALLALLDAPAAGGDYNAKPAWMAATGIAGRDWSEVSVREALAVAPPTPDAQALGIGRYGLPLDRLGQFAERLQLSGEETLTPALQDRLALALAHEAGVNDWLEGRIDQGQWQANLTRLRTTLT